MSRIFAWRTVFNFLMAKVNPYPTSGVRRPKVNQLFAFVFLSSGASVLSSESFGSDANSIPSTVAVMHPSPQPAVLCVCARWITASLRWPRRSFSSFFLLPRTGLTLSCHSGASEWRCHVMMPAFTQRGRSLRRTDTETPPTAGSVTARSPLRQPWAWNSLVSEN